MPFQEVVEAEGHLIDSHIMENIFDKVVEHSGRFEVEEFRIGRTNSEPSYLRLKVEPPDERGHGAPVAGAAGAGLRRRAIRATRASRSGARPVRAGRFLFHHQPPHLRAPRRASGSKWRTSAWTPWWWWRAARARCRRLRDLRRGDRIVAGLRGIRVVPESKERGRLAFAFMANGISSERQVETAVRQTAELVRPDRSSRSRKWWWWQGPWWCIPAAWKACRR